MDQIARDRKLIEALGGPTEVARLLGYQKFGGQQRVQNWLGRGIPPAEKVKRPDLLMPELAQAQAAPAQAATETTATQGA